MAHLKIVENHAFSQEGKGAQNCLCRKVGPFVEAWSPVDQQLIDIPNNENCGLKTDSLKSSSESQENFEKPIVLAGRKLGQFAKMSDSSLQLGNKVIQRNNDQPTHMDKLKESSSDDPLELIEDELDDTIDWTDLKSYKTSQYKAWSDCNSVCSTSSSLMERSACDSEGNFRRRFSERRKSSQLTRRATVTEFDRKPWNYGAGGSQYQKLLYPFGKNKRNSVI